MFSNLPRAVLQACVLVALSSATLAQCELARLVASDAVLGDELGKSVSVSGSQGFVGAPFVGDLGSRSGAVYVVEQTAGGWAITDKLRASDGTAHDNFGMSVAVDGGRALVGAPGVGTVYAFERTPSGWVEVQKLVSSDQPDGSFGKSLSLAADRAAIGAETNDSIVEREGAAYVFEHDGATWVERAKLAPPDGREGDWFGGAVALAGDTIAVGARGHDLHGFSGKGATYLYEKSGPSWGFVEKLSIYEGNDSDGFGSALTMDGERLVVSATGELSPAGAFGVLHVFRKTPAGWVEEQVLYSEGPDPPRYGNGFALSGDRILVGAAYAGDPDAPTGRVYVYERSASGWEIERDFVSAQSAAWSGFGTWIAVSGDTVLIGTPRGGDECDGPYDCDSGAVFAYSLPLTSTQRFCPATPNSSGQPALLSLAGCARVASNDVQLDAAPVPQGKPGIFFYGDRALAPVPFGDGFRCTGGRVFRLPLVHASSGEVLSFTMNLSSPPQSTGQITPGSTWFFQAYYRDTAAGASGFNLSDALEVLFH